MIEWNWSVESCFEEGITNFKNIKTMMDSEYYTDYLLELKNRKRLARELGQPTGIMLTPDPFDDAMRICPFEKKSLELTDLNNRIYAEIREHIEKQKAFRKRKEHKKTCNMILSNLWLGHFIRRYIRVPRTSKKYPIPGPDGFPLNLTDRKSVV